MTVVTEIEGLASTTDLSVRAIQRSIGAKIGRGVVGDIVKRIRHKPRLDKALKHPGPGSSLEDLPEEPPGIAAIDPARHQRVGRQQTRMTCTDECH